MTHGNGTGANKECRCVLFLPIGLLIRLWLSAGLSEVSADVNGGTRAEGSSMTVGEGGGHGEAGGVTGEDTGDGVWQRSWAKVGGLPW